MKTLGQRISGNIVVHYYLKSTYNQEKKSYNFTEEVLKEMVRQVSEDKENETLEFNEFLTMLGLQNIENIKFASLFEAFR